MARLPNHCCEPVLTVDLGALAANYAAVRSLAGGAEVAAVVKADGYGLGAGPVARALWAAGARSFFVARPSEGAALRGELGGERPATVYVLDGCPPGAAARLEAAELTPVLNSLPQVEAWAAHARSAGRPLAAAIHVDTGMNRLGLRVEEAAALVASDRLRGLDINLVMSHLACAETPDHPLNALQAHRFAAARALFPDARASLANSAGVRLGEAFRFDLVRPGIALYGGGPGMRPVATLTAPVLQVRAVAPGESVGYGATFTADRPMRVAVVAAGYADGVLRSAARHGYGWLRGAARPLLGRISMDLIALDVSDVAGEQGGVLAGDVLAGDTVELIGPNILLDDAAHAAGTIGYELLVRVGARAPRAYVGAAG